MYSDKEDREEERIVLASEERQIVKIAELEEKTKEARAGWQFRVGVALICAVSFLLLLYLISAIAVGNRQDASDEPPATEVQAEWRGAFDSREISEESIALCVGVRAGGAGEFGAPSASGFVIDNGWVATSSSFLSGAQRGRVYVIDSVGREHPVNALATDGERGVAFLRIASGLPGADDHLGSDGLCVGEKLISVSSSGAPEHSAKLGVGSFGARECTVWLGDNSGRREGQMYTDMSFEGSALGSPVFDSSGRIVAMALIDGSGYVTPIEEIVESFRALT
jgi:S1-C subfamily serine protease